MKKKTLYASLVLLFPGILIIFQGCYEDRVSIPSNQADDRAPVVTIRALPSAGTGKVEKEESVADPGEQENYQKFDAIRITPGTKLVFFCEATNKTGGVEQLRFKVFRY